MEDFDDIDEECRWCGPNCKCEVVCDICHMVNGEHDLHCPENESPYANLLRDGFD